MSRIEVFLFVSMFLGLAFCSEHAVSQQIIPLSINISSDSFSLIQSEFTGYEEDIYTEYTDASDNILFREQLKLTPANCSFLSPDLNIPSDSVSDKSEWFLTSMLEDQGKLWTSPLRIKTRDLKFWIPVITTTIVTFVYDEEIYKGIKDFQNKHGCISDISPIITQAGDDPFVLGTGGVFFLSGVISGNKKAQQTGLIALQTWFHTGFIVQVGKLLFGRQRPSYDKGEDRWYGFPASLNRFKGEPVSKFDAFPSGHTIEAFGLATVIAEQYKDIKIIPVISYTIATAAGLSRITEDAHWLSDVIMGAALGHCIGKFMVRERKNTQWTLFPKATNDGLKMTAICRF